jgi:hypothetical protein
MKTFRAPVLAAVALLVGAIATVHADDIRLALAGNGDDAELAGECKVVYVNGEPDHCIVVIPGTDTPVAMNQGN